MLNGCGLRGPSCLANLESIRRRGEHWAIAELVGKRPYWFVVVNEDTVLHLHSRAAEENAQCVKFC
jgi:hypothetical protein